MRNAFAQEITKLGQEREDLILLSGDIGNRMFDKYQEHCPERFYNCGIAEANMIGMATGLTMTGFRVVCYTIAPFITYRCMEQIRVDLCYHHVPVTLVGTGAGLSYASLGATHHSMEEMGMLRTLPHMAVLAPGDAMEVKAALRAAIDYPDPVYIRIGKKGEPVIHKEEPALKIGKALNIREGNDLCILNSGNMLGPAVECAERLQEQGISARVESFHSIKPLDEATLEEVFSRYDLVATMEEHSVIGGLGGAVAEWMAGHPGLRGRLLRFGGRDEFVHETSHQDSAREFYGLTVEAMCSRMKETLSAKEAS